MFFFFLATFPPLRIKSEGTIHGFPHHTPVYIKGIATVDKRTIKSYKELNIHPRRTSQTH